jgi:hypothetical protein
MVLRWSPAAPLVLLYAVMAILVVYSTSLFVDEDVVGFGYGDELVVGGVVSPVVD